MLFRVAKLYVYVYNVKRDIHTSTWLTQSFPLSCLPCPLAQPFPHEQAAAHWGRIWSTETSRNWRHLIWAMWKMRERLSKHSHSVVICRLRDTWTSMLPSSMLLSSHASWSGWSTWAQLKWHCQWMASPEISMFPLLRLQSYCNSR